MIKLTAAVFMFFICTSCCNACVETGFNFDQDMRNIEFRTPRRSDDTPEVEYRKIGEKWVYRNGSYHLEDVYEVIPRENKVTGKEDTDKGKESDSNEDIEKRRRERRRKANEK